MTHDELLVEIDIQLRHLPSYFNAGDKTIAGMKALRAVVELIQEKQKFLEETKGDIPMTNQQLGAREERTKLLAEIIQVIEEQIK